MAAYRRVYDSCNLQADCQEPESAPEPYARLLSMGYLYLLLLLLDPFNGFFQDNLGKLIPERWNQYGLKMRQEMKGFWDGSDITLAGPYANNLHLTLDR